MLQPFYHHFMGSRAGNVEASSDVSMDERRQGIDFQRAKAELQEILPEQLDIPRPARAARV